MPHNPLPRAVQYANATILTFPYDADLVEALKRDIPARSRSYNPVTRAWTVRTPYAERAIWLLRQFFPHAQCVTAGAHRQDTQSHPTREPLARPSHYTVLHVLPSAPPEVVGAAYRALAKLHHPDALPVPDRDRATQQMQEINIAIEALRAEGRA